MIRSFVAITIPDGILQQIDAVNTRLRQLHLDARFVKISSIHLTLKFLGDIQESQLESIIQILEERVQSTDRFRLYVEGMGVFPSRKRPRIIWVGIREEPGLLRLHQQVEDGLQRVGFELERKPFKPHLTLVRLKSSRNLSKLQQFLKLEGGEVSLGSFGVQAIHLYQSILRPEGATYRKLATCAL